MGSLHNTVNRSRNTEELQLLKVKALVGGEEKGI